MTELLIEDHSSGDHVLRAMTVSDLPPRMSLRDLLELRIRTEVDRFNRDGQARVFVGLIQPADSIAYSDGFHLDGPRELDADRQIATALEAVGLGLLSFELDGKEIESLDDELDVEGAERLTVHLRRPVVARRPDA